MLWFGEKTKLKKKHKKKLFHYLNFHENDLFPFTISIIAFIPEKMLSEQDETNMRLATTHCSKGLVSRTIFKDELATSTSFD